jgi:hypothetical protein
VSVSDVAALRQLGKPQINVGPFTPTEEGAHSQLSCRAGRMILTPDGESYSEYVRKALIDDHG